MSRPFPLAERTFSIILVLVCSIAFPGIAGSDTTGNNSDYIVTKRLLSIENGLASHEVFCGVQDSSGFLWFGTRNGLNRYDGQNCLLFSRQRNKLQDNKVVQLAKDDANRLFIQYGSSGFQLTTNGKVDVMDATTHEVKTLTSTFPNLPFKEHDVYWIANDGTDEISLLTASPFRYWRYSSKKGFRLCFEMKEWNDLPVDFRTTGPLSTFIQGKALLKLNNQERQYLISGREVTSFQQEDVLRSLPIGFTPNNELLITYNKSSNSDSFVIDKLERNGQLSPVSELNKYHLSTVKGRYWFQVWAATGGEATAFYIATDALYLWNKNAFVKVLDRSEVKGFENLFIYRLFADKLGTMWMCTSLGVFQLKLRKNKFVPYFSTNQQSVEPNSQARGIYADTSGKVVANSWTHTFSQKAGRINYVENPLIHYALVSHNKALYSGGFELFRYDEVKNKMIPSPGGSGAEIWSMYSLNDSLLLLGRTNGFLLFNSASHRFDSIPTTDVATPEARFVYRFFKDKTGTVWAVAENGLYKFSLDANHKWTVKKQIASFLDQLSFLDAWKDADGIFWLATNGEGLYRWNPKTGESRQFNITAGFPSDVLYRIEPDDFDNLWISSDYGLVRFNRKTFLVTTYTTNDGILHNEFNRTSSFRARDGRLYFGGLNGVNGFDPKDFKADVAGLRVPFQVISFNQFNGAANELINRTNEFLRNPSIVLNPDDKFFTLDFQLLDFAKEEGHRYAYKIEGVDRAWNFINENSVRISGLPYGKFVLRIKAQNKEGAWNQQELSIPVNVLKPIYLQWWFIAALALLVIVAIYFLIWFRLKQLARDKRLLEETVNERTVQLKKALSEQSALLLEKDVLMKEIHHRVKNNLQVISGLLELQSKTLTDENARVALQEGRNRVRSIALIHQNLYQFEKLSTIDLRRFINDLSRQVQSVFQRREKVVMTIDVPELHLDIDSAVPLGLILNELLTNSFKYAFGSFEEGKINLAIHSTGEGKYQLLYTDNGPGLPDGFDLNRSTTLGLQLVTDLTRQIGGRVEYENRHGATFTINFTNREVRKNQD